MNHETVLIKWIESFVITILFILAGEFLQDPLSLKSVFPWIWFAPVLIALRYGIWPSQCSIVLCLLSYLYKNPAQIYEIHFQHFLLGGFLLTVVCSIFQNSWSRKINYSKEIANYLQKRIQITAHAYKVVVFAYQRLEHSFIEKPVTVRSSVGELRQMLAQSNETLQENILNRFLNILVFHCSLEVAAIFPVKNKQIISDSIVSVGKIKMPNPEDFLIQECIENLAIAHVTKEEILKGHLSDYLLVVPFLDQAGAIYALLVIEEMPFLKLNDGNLKTINLLVQYFTEGTTVKNADLILKEFADCTVDFANELQRLTNVQKNTGQDSAVVALLLSVNPHQEEYLFKLKQQKRGIDTLWETSDDTNKILLILMPLTNRLGIESYKERINEILLSEFNITLNNQEIKFKSCLISSINNPIHLIQDLLNIK